MDNRVVIHLPIDTAFPVYQPRAIVTFTKEVGRPTLLDMLDQVEARRRVENRSRHKRPRTKPWTVATCPGCSTWSTSWSPKPRSRALRSLKAAYDATAEHRRECPAFDMLCGFAGVPPS